jgi:hypothetical protein
MSIGSTVGPGFIIDAIMIENTHLNGNLNIRKQKFSSFTK